MTRVCNNHLYELDGDSRLADPSPPDHHDFVLVLVHPLDHLHDHQQLNGPPSAASAASDSSCQAKVRVGATAWAWGKQQQQQQLPEQASSSSSSSSRAQNWKQRHL